MFKSMWIKNKLTYLYQVFGKEISAVVNSRRSTKDKKQILLYCSNSTMEEYLLDYLETIENCFFCDYYVYFGGGYVNGNRHRLQDTSLFGKNIQVIKNEGNLFWKKWDLIVCADLEYPFKLKKGTIPLLHVKHGFSDISYDGGDHTYTYGEECLDDRGEALFDIMLEPNLMVVNALQEENEEFRKILRHTGYKHAERIITEAERKSYYREQLKINDERIVVCFFGSWNESSLFHVLGENLFAECERLMQEYVFIYSIHPKEYYVYDEKVKPMGELIERQREKGFLVRSPGEDWMPFLMASDIVVADYTSMTTLALLAGKKIVFSYFSDSRIWKKSLCYQAKCIFPELREAGELEKILKRVQEEQNCEDFIDMCRDNLYVSLEKYNDCVREITRALLYDRDITL